ncbi:MAG: hypothetical protein HWN80_01355 [Candidatus Lokiarchaeota archaeon]|nr:hypothetical protein [Candidatus Lokiarchaeota archaeon]
MKTASANLQKKIEELSELAYKAVTILSNCKSCGTCIRFCPLNIRKLNNQGKSITITSDYNCGGCSVCYHRCPNNAIKIVNLKK